ncbi:TMEM143 family protein [Pseudoalteromonas tunicata]|jgi:hypothetical protein|uniref:Putative orphan protein putative membrane protein n=1 Tax=Pseudoalteromonas tunicata D2 TaxID=87626 RepID=A4C4R3_9GAMM|nr:TMEM143 family protein [Pseudoalteromonas tunicata]ATC96976.1 hypothetical protein PTUN_b0621 [Pseudoalteromonas tunicata]EAR30545.1 putative orphan protein; putative membrane protein [Pseudoalteromonas tunicata D2]MDP4982137.1 TMEM143 family protein [Pseudoalteromonas tunicata]MDP5213902.1 TMEM143 family protein [Pseudoalteromonas tunicata]
MMMQNNNGENKRENFIPLSKQDVIKQCHALITQEQQVSFSDFCSLLDHYVHQQHHQLLNRLKNNYAYFDPNRDTLQVDSLNKTQYEAAHAEFHNSFLEVLKKANFEQITEHDLQQALAEESLFKVRLEVDFSDFAQVIFYRRGEQTRTEQLQKWFGLKKYSITFTNYERIAIYIQFKDAQYFKTINKQPVNFIPGSTIIKLFQNVPKADLEMLFPNSEVRMRQIDKFIIASSAVVGGTAVLITKLGASLILLFTLFSYWFGLSQQEVVINQQQLIALGLGMAIFGSFIFKEWTKFKNRKIKFMKTLADNLYFKNLDNNAGVFHHLLDNAEDEEFKETLLGYVFLLNHPQGLTATELDSHIENWLSSQYSLHIDFEIEDSLTKLLNYKLINKVNSLYYAVELNQAKKILDERWDKLFEFN